MVLIRILFSSLGHSAKVVNQLDNSLLAVRKEPRPIVLRFNAMAAGEKRRTTAFSVDFSFADMILLV
jgi:hypothetical protein